MLFKYKAVTSNNEQKDGTIDAVTMDVAIAALQKKGFILTSIDPAEGEKPFWQREFVSLQKITNRDIVILSRQIATLFEAQVSALTVFRMLGEESENPALGQKLLSVADDVQGGVSISSAMGKHPEVFTSFYVNMVAAGEQSGKLNQTFLYLADYLERSYELQSKAKNALIYPAFVVFTFIAVMVLMLTFVIPKLSAILLESAVDIPIYTRVVIAISDFLVNYGIFFSVFFVIVAYTLWKYMSSRAQGGSISQFRLAVPYIGDLYRKLYLSRISDNIDTMLGSGIPMVKTIEITAEVVGDETYKGVLLEAARQVRAGSSISSAFSGNEYIPGIMIQMMRIGEETGELGKILKTLARFYKREVDNAVDTLVGLIEPIMIVALGLGVGTLLASILIPIYQITATF
ncbi:type II secretion system F family protein [bacterium]|nr:type II secretion system F family protein [bacterium]MCI0565660.1 type II secretion system F family protein [bacterium]MCI0679958.1 type II secretion system F family protein [bacterium]